MRRITLWLLSTVAVLVLLFSYRTSTNGTVAGSVAGKPAAQRATATGSGSGGDGAYDGSVVSTRWGEVQVRITVGGGKITDVAAVRYPNDNPRDKEINAYALPILRQAALDAQSADIDSVSGATVTSDGYRESLQAAIDAAHLS